MAFKRSWVRLPSALLFFASHPRHFSTPLTQPRTPEPRCSARPLRVPATRGVTLAADSARWALALAAARRSAMRSSNSSGRADAVLRCHLRQPHELVRVLRYLERHKLGVLKVSARCQANASRSTHGRLRLQKGRFALGPYHVCPARLPARRPSETTRYTCAEGAMPNAPC